MRTFHLSAKQLAITFYRGTMGKFGGTIGKFKAAIFSYRGTIPKNKAAI